MKGGGVGVVLPDLGELGTHLGAGCKVQGAGCRVQGAGYRVHLGELRTHLGDALGRNRSEHLNEPGELITLDADGEPAHVDKIR